jgi:hypothetical protein
MERRPPTVPEDPVRDWAIGLRRCTGSWPFCISCIFVMVLLVMVLLRMVCGMVLAALPFETLNRQQILDTQIMANLSIRLARASRRIDDIEHALFALLSHSLAPSNRWSY